MKRLALALGFILFLVWGVNSTDWVVLSFTKAPTIVGEAAVVIDEASGEVLYEKNKNKRLFPASTIKIVTALVVLEKADINDVIIVGDEVLRQTPGESSAQLEVGQALTLDDLLHALLLPFGNDAARTIALYVVRKESGNANLPYEESERYFANLMNEKVKEIGAHHSNFVNPHGLHDEEHYTTAFDLALIAVKARKNAHLRNIFGEDAYEVAPLHVTNRN